MENVPTPLNDRRMDRRTALKWVASAAGSVYLFRPDNLLGQPSAPSKPSASGAGAPPATPVVPEEEPLGPGYGTDPEMMKDYKPGECWPLSFTPEQRLTATILADLIIPSDDVSPSASSVGVVDFIDEWISAPYRQYRRDKKLMLEGLAWLDQEATLRFAKNFRALTPVQQTAICDDISYLYRASEEHLLGARFFALFRDLTAGGFYSTPIGWKDVQYVGNVPCVDFAGPPESVLKKLGIV